MKRVLFVGYDPKTVDFSDHTLPPGMTVEKIGTGVEVALKQMADRGYETDLCCIRPDQSAVPTVLRQLSSKTNECIVIGAGVRLPQKSLLLSEALINAVRKSAPTAAIALNTRPERLTWQAAG
jgi:hypothetical protein